MDITFDLADKGQYIWLEVDVVVQLRFTCYRH